MHQMNNYIQIDNYQIDKNKIIGTGGFATVYLGYYAKGKCQTQDQMNKLFAIKEISINSEFEITNSLIREINVLRHLKNRHIIQFIDAKKTENHFYLIMEYCSEGSLDDLVGLKVFTENQILIYFYQIVHALEYLFTKKIFHRDIKPKNILLHNGEIKLVDFGLSKIIADQNINATMGLNTCVGTPQYMAPEMLRGIGWQEKSDIWSLGVTLYYMIFKELPWDQYSNSSMTILEQIEKVFSPQQQTQQQIQQQQNSNENQNEDQKESAKIQNIIQNENTPKQQENFAEIKQNKEEDDVFINKEQEQKTQNLKEADKNTLTTKCAKNKLKNIEELRYLLPKDKNPQDLMQVSISTLRLLDSMLQVDTEKRISWKQLFSIPQIQDYMSNYIKKDNENRGQLQKKKSLDEVTPETLIVTYDESGENQEELQMYGALWNQHIDELKKQKELSQKAKQRIEFESEKAKFLDQVSIMLKHQFNNDKTLIPKDLYVKCQFLLYKRANIILSDLSKMMAFRLNSYGSVLIDEELWNAFVDNWDNTLCENIVKENTYYEKRFSMYQIEMNQVYKKLEKFEMIQRGDAYTQQLDENPNLVQAFNDNFLKLFQILSEKAINLRKEDKIIGKKNKEDLKINIVFIYYLMIVLSFKNVFTDPETNLSEFYQDCENIGCIELLSRIEQAYKLWYPMEYN